MTALVVSALLALQIEGAGSCPTAAEVDGKLIPLLSPGFATSSADLAVIAEEPDGALSLSLARPDGRTIARRRLPRSGTCDEQAEMVAVTIAVWEAQIHPEISLRLDRLAGTGSSSAPPAAPPAAPALTLARSSERAPARLLMPSIGGAVVGSWQPDSVAPGGRLDATLGAAGRSWRARLSLAGLGKHTVSLAPGQAEWWRLYAALGADYVLPLGRLWQVAAGVAGVVGVINAEGSGFSNNRTARATDLGAEAMLRLELRLGVMRPWLGLALVTWLRRQTLDVTGEAGSAVVPRLEPLIALGADFCWRP
jgi:hypothetical protein